VLDEAHTLSEELQVHFDNYSIIKKSVQGKIDVLLKSTLDITGMSLDDARFAVERECERLESQIQQQLSVR
jgi:hypothetical protein